MRPRCFVFLTPGESRVSREELVNKRFDPFASHGGGNFLAALGLLCYTEFGGKLKYDCRHPNGREHASENFNRFFDDLGPGYRALHAAGHNIYDIFRCGLAHEYWVKQACTIAMVGGGHPAGIFVQADGRYVFVVEQYCRDLELAFDGLEVQLYGPPPKQ